MSIEFSGEIERLEKSLQEKRELLAKLESKREAHSVQTQRAREAIQDLRAVLRGDKPPSKSGKKKTSHGVSSVPVNKDTGRPARGARTEQIREICRHLGASGDIFRTANVLGVLRDVEEDVDAGMRSYTYSVMNNLEEEGVIERQGRGKWLWKG